ncbi:MAG: hypothetical protein ACK4V4_07120 [Sphingobacteriales bacterium]|jgi:hypothetical protein
MDRRDYIDEFEEFLQENADQHKLYPSDKVWAGIHRSIHQPKTKWSYLFVAMIFMGLGIAGKIFDSQFTLRSTSLTSTTFSLTEQDVRLNSVLQKMKTVDPQKMTDQFPKSAQMISPAQNNEMDMSANQELQGLVNAEQHVDLDIEKITGQEMIGSNRSIVLPPLHRNTTITIPTNRAATPVIQDINIKSDKGLRLGWQFYISPTTSFRRLSGKGLPYYTNAGNNMTSVFAANDIERSVTHKPSLGFEMGGAITYQATNSVRLKAGLQFNVNRYEVQAFHSVPEVAPMTNNTGSGSINVVSTFRNYSGFSKTWLKNQHIMMSFPIGAEIKLIGNDNISLNIAGTIQPTIVINNQAYMISTNMRNYAKAPSLYREFNVAGGAEAFLSIKRKSLRFNVGPQFRYQLISSYKKPYPISEHLTDYGLKVSIGR